VSPVKYELRFYIPQDDILHSHCRGNLKSDIEFQHLYEETKKKYDNLSECTVSVVIPNEYHLDKSLKCYRCATPLRTICCNTCSHYGRLYGAQGRSGRCGEGKYPMPFSGIKPRFPGSLVHIQVGILRELCWLLLSLGRDLSSHCIRVVERLNRVSGSCRRKPRNMRQFVQRVFSGEANMA
jgi:hypothetical protein